MTTKPIVVGVDGSPGSQLALEWAVHEGRARAAPVVVVHVWRLPYIGDAAGMAAFAIDGKAVERAAGELLEAAIDDVTESAPDAGITITSRLEQGDTAGRLLATAAELDADVLVVGSRGRGGFAGLLLGSVSQQVVHHATCPVVVVPSRPGK